jgi:hypothetical protein
MTKTLFYKPVLTLTPSIRASPIDFYGLIDTSLAYALLSWQTFKAALKTIKPFEKQSISALTRA